MNPGEFQKEILKDYRILMNSNSLARLASDYDRERRRAKIPREKDFHRFYNLKTKQKNNWVLMFTKSPSIDKYKDRSSLNVCFLTYFYRRSGLEVYQIMPDEKIIVYIGHLFQRYNERLNLGFNSIWDSIRKYFTYNCYGLGHKTRTDDKVRVVNVCKDGYIFGEERDGWFVFKTFITKDLARADQNEIGINLMKYLISELENQKNYLPNSPEYIYNQDIFNVLKQKA